MRFLSRLFRRLARGLFGLLSSVWHGVCDGLFGVHTPPELDDADADAIAERAVDHSDVDELRAKIAAERARQAAAPVRRVVPPPLPAPESERWYAMLNPLGGVDAYARGTESEADAFWQWGGDGYGAEPVTDSGLLFHLGLVAGLPDAKVGGVPVTWLADEVAEWRSQRTGCGYN